MIHIKRVELFQFKSFGGTTKIPLLPGFTVVSGPNGSGKSNIIDALLFCLGLSTSRGMRAERLPDLVNHDRQKKGRAAETKVSVTFALSSEEEWTVTRRLRIAKGGSYSSIYSINEETCTAGELHEQLNSLRIYSEGYNVVLQGDVTRIITMNSRERREIIDELAGVAEFDRKIEQTKKTLDSVKDREERCQIIQQELIKARDRLAKDRVKAQKYRELKQKIQEQQQWEIVLTWRSLQQESQQLQANITAGEEEATKLESQLNSLSTDIKETSTSLKQLNARVKELGEEEQLDLANQLATRKVKRHQLQQQQEELKGKTVENEKAIATLRQEREQLQENLQQLITEKAQLETETLPLLQEEQHRASRSLEESREKANAIATAAKAWVEEQTTLSRKVAQLQQQLEPQRTEQAKLSERQRQLEQKITEQSQLLEETIKEITLKEEHSQNLSTQIAASETEIQSLAEQLAASQKELDLQQETQNRLLKEQREKQRQLDKLEAAKQAQQEAEGTYATRIILQSDLPGVCGLVAQLARVASEYQPALEIAAGSRLGNIVVEDDSIAAAGIALLKQERGGRATFLPLNKIQASQPKNPATLSYAKGFIDLAVNLIDCNSRYQSIFAYVFGNTVVFENLATARLHLGKQRIVTLEGDLLAPSGAMTGGSKPSRSQLHFGTAAATESKEIQTLSSRLEELEHILEHCNKSASQNRENVKKLTEKLTEARQQGREGELRQEQLKTEIERLRKQKKQIEEQIVVNRQERSEVAQKLAVLAVDIPQLEAELAVEQEKLARLEEKETHSEWNDIQTLIKSQEKELQKQEQSLRQAEEKLKDWQNKQLRYREKLEESDHREQEYLQSQLHCQERGKAIEIELEAIIGKIAATEQALGELGEKLGETKEERDRLEASLRTLQEREQKKTWALQKLQETQAERRVSLESLQQQLQAKEIELPSPLPEIPQLIADPEGETTTSGEPITFGNYRAQLEQLQKQLQQAQKNLEAMEPVNMLALEEYEQTQGRLEELSSKLATLEAERTELLVRVENFTTLRLRAFKEAFDVVNENFQTIFATLSEGDGYLELESDEDPFKAGLNLIAHPKGKPVQRLSSMSGGEKSLTALSFIFALQRYRPSPFYAFDEVDMFLDGANVERLAKMIKQQAQEAQFIVVSLRRPMIESSERTIGVTQARGAYTQVLGIKI